jgi:predicted DNA-binding antitoxin AbrB/MazE fold protein
VKRLTGDLVLVKAVYENNVLKPLEKLNLQEGTVVEIEVKRDAVDRLGGLVKISRQDLIDEIFEGPESKSF